MSKMKDFWPKNNKATNPSPATSTPACPALIAMWTNHSRTLSTNERFGNDETLTYGLSQRHRKSIYSMLRSASKSFDVFTYFQLTLQNGVISSAQFVGLFLL